MKRFFVNRPVHKLCNLTFCAVISFLAIIPSSCGVGKHNVYGTVPEESGMNMMKITDESTKVLGINIYGRRSKTPTNSLGGNYDFSWGTDCFLSISPDGTELAYLSRIENQQNIMIRRANPGSVATQRTFRNVSDFYWGNDDNIYYCDFTNSTSSKNVSQICSSNAHSGSLMKQLTNNNQDYHPALSSDGKCLFFTRYDNAGFAIWSYNLEDGALTSCARGFQAAVIPNDNDKFVCIRNSETRTEIWLVDYVKNQETLILSDKDKGFSNPVVSSDGKWLLCQGNSKSAKNRVNNIDLYAMRLDGTNFVQLTYSEANDFCPVWSPDGKYIYFISDRSSKDRKYNIWRMNSPLY